MSEFFESDWGGTTPTNFRSPVPWIKDAFLQARLAFSPKLSRIIDAARRQPPRRVLVVSVAVPGREAQLASVIEGLSRSRHQVDVSTTPMKPQGKFANIDDAIRAARSPLSSYDWLIVTDDDIGFDANFLDTYLALAEAADLALSQPAHRHASHASFFFSRRRAGSLVRASRFVEIGPLTALRADTFADLVPFPPSKWCYGIDVLWSDIARRRGWTIGIIDAAPVSHLKPIAATYNMGAAIAEGHALLAAHGVKEGRREDLLQSWVVIPA